MSHSASTSLAAAPFLASVALWNPTYLVASEIDLQQRPLPRIAAIPPSGDSKRKSSTAANIFYTNDLSLSPSVPDFLQDRETTRAELVIGEIREWTSLASDWDGEGANAPIAASLKAAESFVCGWSRDDNLLEPMLSPTGHAGLLWDSPDAYADLKFLEDGQIAYFIKKNTDRHKGLVAFNGKDIPSVFLDLIGSEARA